MVSLDKDGKFKCNSCHDALEKARDIAAAWTDKDSEWSKYATPDRAIQAYIDSLGNPAIQYENVDEGE